MNDTQQTFTASWPDGGLVIRHCTCSFTWGLDELGRVTEVRRPGLSCATHPQETRSP